MDSSTFSYTYPLLKDSPFLEDKSCFTHCVAKIIHSDPGNMPVVPPMFTPYRTPEGRWFAGHSHSSWSFWEGYLYQMGWKMQYFSEPIKGIAITALYNPDSCDGHAVITSNNRIIWDPTTWGGHFHRRSGIKTSFKILNIKLIECF